MTSAVSVLGSTLITVADSPTTDAVVVMSDTASVGVPVKLVTAVSGFTVSTSEAVRSTPVTCPDEGITVVGNVSDTKDSDVMLGAIQAHFPSGNCVGLNFGSVSFIFSISAPVAKW